MRELRIWTARHTVKVAAPPKRVFELVADMDCWPALFESLVSVDHLGFDGACERVRIWKRTGGETQCRTMLRERNPKRMQVRFRHIDLAAPIASMGGLWLVVPKSRGSVIALDHYYRVTDDSPVTAASVERDIAVNCTSMLATFRQTAEFSGMADLVRSCSDR